MDNLDRQIEARARALEVRAEQVCARMLDLEQRNNALAYRPPGGAGLNLLDAKPCMGLDHKDRIR